MIRWAWAAGGHVSPWSFFDTTAQFRLRYDNNSCYDKRESDPGTTTARSAFFEEMDRKSAEFTTRSTLKPCRWFQTSFRYIVRDIDYATRAEGESTMTSDVLQNDYIFDAPLVPLPELYFTGSLTKENLATKTPATSNFSSIPLPGFDANVNTWMLSASYAPRKDLSADSSVYLSYADNFNDYTDIGLPYGADFARTGVTVSLKWTPKKHITIKPEYGLYRYTANPFFDSGSYTAHLVGMETNIEWG